MDSGIASDGPAADARGADILVVDDTPANLQLLSGMLKEGGYRVRLVPSGKLALTSAANRRPDLILLDINMPEMDGYEVCRRLKSDPTLAPVPVIFISALSEPLDKVKAFGSGGVDYVTKPFQIEEVGARVRTHLEIRRLQLALEEHNRELVRTNAALRESELLRDNLTHMIVHDMRTPLSGILLSLQFIEKDVGSRLPRENLDDLRQASSGAQRLNRMINDLLDITRLEEGQLPLARRAIDVAELFAQAVATLGGLTRGRRLQVAAPAGLTIDGDVELLRRVLVNIVGNALKFTPDTGLIDVAATAVAGGVRVAVRDEGPGIDPRFHAHVFEKFGQVTTQGRLPESSGLGLAFCRMVVEAHGGRIGLDSAPGRGSTFWLELPDGR